MFYKSYNYAFDGLSDADFDAYANNKLTENILKSNISSVGFQKLGEKTTVCLLTLKNGYEIVGTSSCVDPKNFNQETGEEISFKNAVNKLWMIEGYFLQKTLYNRNGSMKGVKNEN